MRGCEQNPHQFGDIGFLTANLPDVHLHPVSFGVVNLSCYLVLIALHEKHGVVFISSLFFPISCYMAMTHVRVFRMNFGNRKTTQEASLTLFPITFLVSYFPLALRLFHRKKLRLYGLWE